MALVRRVIAVSLAVCASLAFSAGSASAAVTFDGSPGTGPPPATLGPYTMTSFPATDSRTPFTTVTTIPSPLGGDVGLDSPFQLLPLGGGWSSNWTAGFSGTIYFSSFDDSAVLTLPADTKAFYFYSHSNAAGFKTVTAQTQDGTTSGPVSVFGGSSGNAQYFGFYATGADVISTITITYPAGSLGFGIGQMGIAEEAGTTITVDKDFTDDNTTDYVTVSLNCGDASVTTVDATATESDDAEFRVEDFDSEDVCSASEGDAPSGYTKDETDCEILDPETDTTCTIVNDLNEATIEVSKEYSDGESDPVEVVLTCTGGTIDDDSQPASPGTPAVFTVTKFDPGDDCSASEDPVPAGYAQDDAACQDIDLQPGDAEACRIYNVQATTLTAGGCTFDRDSARSGSQFPLIYTPEPGTTNVSKLNATNPGQFFLNVAYSGDASSLDIEIPYPFITVGTNPVKVYNSVSAAYDGSKTCFTPGTGTGSETDQVTWDWSADGFGDTSPIEVDTSGGDFTFVRIHLAYGLKGVAGGCARNLATPPTATCSTPSVGFVIAPFEDYTFSFSDADTTSDDATVESFNVFKKNPGVGGLVSLAANGDPIVGAKADIYNGTKKVATAYSDADGWYMWAYKYTGKAASFTVKLPAYALQQSATLKSNGFVAFNFAVP